MHRFLLDYGDLSSDPNQKILDWVGSTGLEEATVDQMVLNKLGGTTKRLYNFSEGASKGYVLRISHDAEAIMFKLKFQNRIRVEDNRD